MGPYLPLVRRNCPPLVGIYLPRVAPALRAPTNVRFTSEKRGLTPCGAVPTRDSSGFVPGLSELWLHERIYEPGMGPYPPLMVLALQTSPSQSETKQRRMGLHAVRGGVDPEDRRYRPRGGGAWKKGRTSEPGMVTCPLRVLRNVPFIAGSLSFQGSAGSTSSSQ